MSNINLRRLKLIFICLGLSLCHVGLTSNSTSSTTINTDKTTSRKISLKLPKTRLSANELGIIINRADPLSVKIGEYYQKARRIPKQNVIYLNFKKSAFGGNLSRDQFEKIKKEIDKKTPRHIQAYAIAWRTPYKVDCMSITSAITFGFNSQYCARGCKPTKISPYYNSLSTRPYHQLGIRPSMLLASKNFDLAKKLIDRGIKSDKSLPTGSAYLLNTNDKSRNVRSYYYPAIKKRFKNIFNVRIIKSNALENKDDVMFYFTGLIKVKKINTNRYLPGAIADHLTSTGGRLINRSQMPADKWLEAGATGSYGNVTEPCNFLSKFPNPLVTMSFYYKGTTLIEAYWKSVAMPGQGLFIGEPLAHPFAGYRISQNTQGSIISTQSLHQGMYMLIRVLDGKFKLIRAYRIKKIVGPTRLEIPLLKSGEYRLVYLNPNNKLQSALIRRMQYYTTYSIIGINGIPLLMLIK